MTHYEALGVPQAASQLEIKAAFDKLRSEYNPDTHSDPSRVVHLAKQIYKAHAILCDPYRRKEYDRFLELEAPHLGTRAISDEEFRSWHEPGKTITGGIAAKIKAENVRIPIYYKSGIYWKDAACTAPFSDQEAAAALWNDKYRQDFREQKTQEQGALVFVVLVIILVILVWGGTSLKDYLDESGRIFHDEMTTVYSPNWQYGEYKTCTTLNGGKPENILCDGGVPSGRIEDGKVFKVRFWGRTYVEGEPAVGGAPNSAPTVFYWNCRKNEEGDPSITCKQNPK
jgi:hypothetical protein